MPGRLRHGAGVRKSHSKTRAAGPQEAAEVCGHNLKWNQPAQTGCPPRMPGAAPVLKRRAEDIHRRFPVTPGGTDMARNEAGGGTAGPGRGHLQGMSCRRQGPGSGHGPVHEVGWRGRRLHGRSHQKALRSHDRGDRKGLGNAVSRS